MTFPLADAKKGIEWRETSQNVDLITRAIFWAAEKELGYPLSLTQGGGKPHTSYSGSTHTKFGVGDLPAYDDVRKCEVLNSLGCYAYIRPYLPGKWGRHIHFGVIDHPWRDSALAAQQVDWLKKPPLDGLASHNRYTVGPHTGGRKIVFEYDASTKRQFVPLNRVQRAREELVLSIHKLGDAMALLDEVENRPVVAARLKRLDSIHKELRSELKEMPKR